MTSPGDWLCQPVLRVPVPLTLPWAHGGRSVRWHPASPLTTGIVPPYTPDPRRLFVLYVAGFSYFVLNGEVNDQTNGFPSTKGESYKVVACTKGTCDHCLDSTSGQWSAQQASWPALLPWRSLFSRSLSHPAKLFRNVRSRSFLRASYF